MKFSKIDLFDWLKTKPHDLLDLASSGISGPKSLRETGIELPDIPIFGYNYYGWQPLKDRLSELYNIPVDWFVITPGASMANFAVTAAIAETGNSILLEHPCYSPFVSVAETITGKSPHYLNRQPQNRYAIEINYDEVEKLQPKLSVTTNLFNPGGTFTDDQTLIRLAESVERFDGWLLIDEIFLPFMADYDWHTVAYKHPRIITTSSLTKVWGLSGLRIGWTIAPPTLARKIERVMDYLHVNQPFISEFVALKILENDSLLSNLLSFARQRAKENIVQVLETLNRIPSIEYTVPDGGIIIFCRFKDKRNSTPFCDQLLHEKKVLVQPGHFFGDNSAFRIGFGCDSKTLAHGLRLIEDTINNNKDC